MHQSKCLSIIMLDSVIKANKEYYPQILFKECKYDPKKIKMESLVDDDLEKSSPDEPGSESDNAETESDDEKDNDKSNE